MSEVRSLLGTPGSSRNEDSDWTYWDRAISPNSRKKESLNICFRGGIVAGVKSESMDTILQN